MKIGSCKNLILMASLLMMPATNAESPLVEGFREVEEIRLRQLAVVQNNGEIAPFKTDGCSGNLSAGWERLAAFIPSFRQEFGEKPPWENCCIEHDRVYWRGDTVDGFNRRKIADQDLRQCVVETGIELAPDLAERFSKSETQVRQTFTVVADIMYGAVRFGGQPCSLLPWRWGYGWPRCAFTPIGGN